MTRTIKLNGFHPGLGSQQVAAKTQKARDVWIAALAAAVGEPPAPESTRGNDGDGHPRSTRGLRWKMGVVGSVAGSRLGACLDLHHPGTGGDAMNLCRI